MSAKQTSQSTIPCREYCERHSSLTTHEIEADSIGEHPQAAMKRDGQSTTDLQACTPKVIPGKYVAEERNVLLLTLMSEFLRLSRSQRYVLHSSCSHD
jgi:hypothetical protein